MKPPQTLFFAALMAIAVCGPFAVGGETPKPDAPAITFPFAYTGEGMANLSGGFKRGAIDEGVVTLGVKGDLDALLGWKGGSFLVSSMYAHGPSLTRKYVHDFNFVSNIDAYDSLRFYEAWFQQEFADGKYSLRVGQILADTEFFVSENGALFLNSTFGAIPLVSQNYHAAAYPVAAPGVRGRWTPVESFSLQAAVFSGDVGDPGVNNKHGLDWRLNGALVLVEASTKLNGDPKGRNLATVFKLGGFVRTPAREVTFADPSCRHANGGGYFIVDQQLWRKPATEDQGLSGFVRLGGTPEDRNTVPFYCDGGFNYKGLLPGREKDLAGIGLSYTQVSKRLVDGAGFPIPTHHETILEATYKIILKDWCAVQPDFQYIFNPGATRKAANALVAGLRFNLTFP